MRLLVAMAVAVSLNAGCGWQPVTGPGSTSFADPAAISLTRDGDTQSAGMQEAHFDISSELLSAASRPGVFMVRAAKADGASVQMHCWAVSNRLAGRRTGAHPLSSLCDELELVVADPSIGQSDFAPQGVTTLAGNAIGGTLLIVRASGPFRNGEVEPEEGDISELEGSLDLPGTTITITRANQAHTYVVTVTNMKVQARVVWAEEQFSVF